MTRTRISLAAARTALWTAAAGAVQICPDCLHFVHTWPSRTPMPWEGSQSLGYSALGSPSGRVVLDTTIRAERGSVR